MIFMSKAQVEIISVVIIIIIAMGLVSSVYMWGLPLIQKQQDAALAERVSNYFSQRNEQISLPGKIEYVANNGGEETFSLDVNGLWALDPTEDSISFTFFSRASNIGKSDWISLTSGAGYPPPSSGTIGIDKPSAVYAKADTLGSGYNITYKIWYRQLNESSGIRGYKINLASYQPGLLTSTGKSARISLGNITTINTGSQTLIITEIKVLFG